MPGGVGGASVRQINYLTDHLPDLKNKLISDTQSYFFNYRSNRVLINFSDTLEGQCLKRPQQMNLKKQG